MLPPKMPGRPRAKFAIFRGRDAHHAAERAQRHDGGRERPADLAVELPVKKIRLREALLEKAEAVDHARPSPAFVRDFEHVDLQHVARLSAFDKNRPVSAWMRSRSMVEIFGERHPGMNLRAARIEAFQVNGVAGSDAEARRQMRDSSANGWARRKGSVRPS